MGEKMQDEGLEVFLARLLGRLRGELETEADEARALRRAILGVIIATSEVDRRAAKRLMTFLLEEFEPLAGRFDDDTHALLNEFGVRRHRDGEDAELMFSQALMSEIMRQPLSPADIELAGLKWPWEVTAQRYIGFFDIMGFKALIEGYGDDHAPLIERMNLLREAAVSAEDIGYDTKAPKGPLNFPGCWLRFAQFSDSIVLITRDTSQQSSAIIALATQFMFARAFGTGIPIRGAIAKGTLTADFDKSTYFGQPLVDAYLLESRQAWYGACYHPSANDGGDDVRTGKPGRGADDVPKDWIPLAHEYPVPVKAKPGHEKLSAINWAIPFRGNPKALDEALESMRNDDPKLRSYFEETQRFGMAMLDLMEREE